MRPKRTPCVDTVSGWTDVLTLPPLGIWRTYILLAEHARFIVQRLVLTVSLPSCCSVGRGGRRRRGGSSEEEEEEAGSDDSEQPVKVKAVKKQRVIAEPIRRSSRSSALQKKSYMCVGV